MKKIMVLLAVCLLSFSCEFLEIPRISTSHGVDAGNNFFFTLTNVGKHVALIEVRSTITCTGNTFHTYDTISDFANGATVTFTQPLGADVYIDSSTSYTTHSY